MGPLQDRPPAAIADTLRWYWAFRVPMDGSSRAARLWRDPALAAHGSAHSNPPE